MGPLTSPPRSEPGSFTSRRGSFKGPVKLEKRESAWVLPGGGRVLDAAIQDDVDAKPLLCYAAPCANT